MQRQLELRHHLHRAEHGRRAAHIRLHRFHGVGRLQRKAAGVEGQALADQADRRDALGRLTVLHHNEARIVGRALADCQDTAEAALSQLGFIEYGHLQAAALAEPHGLVRQLGGRHGIARSVDQLARKRHASRRDQSQPHAHARLGARRARSTDRGARHRRSAHRSVRCGSARSDSRPAPGPPQKPGPPAWKAAAARRGRRPSLRGPAGAAPLWPRSR